MGRKPRNIEGETLQSKILEIAFRHKAKQSNIAIYSIARLAQDADISHSIIVRAAEYNSQKHIGTQPKLETVKKLAETLEVTLNPELEDAFYNAFTYVSPRQLEQAWSYVEKKLQAS